MTAGQSGSAKTLLTERTNRGSYGPEEILIRYHNTGGHGESKEIT